MKELFCLGLALLAISPVGAFEVPAEKCEASRPLFPMDDNAQFQHHWGKGSASLGTNGLVCQGDTTAFALTERKFPVLRYERQPCKLVFDTELLSGSVKVSAAFAYADKDVYETNKTGFTTQEVVLPAGRAKTVPARKAPAKIPAKVAAEGGEEDWSEF